MHPRNPLSPDDLGYAVTENPVVRLLRRPQVLLPVVVVIGMLLFAVALQPGGDDQPTAKQAGVAVATAPAGVPTAAATPSPSATRPGSTPAAHAAASSTASTGVAAADPRQLANGTVTADVAGARATPSAQAEEQDLTQESTQCGVIQESSITVTVEQSISGVGVRATRVAVYPVAYLRCMLMATGGREAVSLASSLGKSERDGGATHAVLLDLWIANAGREFGQVNLKTASIAAAGQSFQPLASLGGRGEVVVSSGEGRTVTLAFTLKSTLGPKTGPMTLTVDAPLLGGKQLAGKYQLFLPTP